MDSSSNDWKHHKRRQSFDENDDKATESSEGSGSHEESGHKKARYSWQIKGGKSSQLVASSHRGDTLHKQQNVVQADSITTCSQYQQDNENVVSRTVRMDEGMCDVIESTHHDVQCYSQPYTDVQCQSSQGTSTASSIQPTAVQHGASNSVNRRHSFPSVRSNLFLNLHHHNTENATDLVVWQNKHVAKSIVDNAINKTLEEMGVLPEKEQDEFMADKSELENQGISEAIKSQGLIGPSHHAESHTEVHVPPLISHLRHLSDLMFIQTTSHSSISSDTTLQQPPLTAYPGSSMSTQIRLSDSSDYRTSQNHQNSQQNAVVRNLPVGNSSNVPSSSSEVLDQAVSLVISKQGLSLQ